MIWIIIVAALVVIGFILDREIYFYEGVHFGPRLQAWLYDRWSRKYDEDKRASQLHDDEMLAQPLLNGLREIPEPFVLDFATGTGRLSFAFLLTSRGTEESGRKAKVKSAIILTTLLEENGFEKVGITQWWKLFDRVIAIKSGSSNPVGMKSLSEALKCSACHAIDWIKTSNIWKCQNCGNVLSVTKEGIVLN